MTNTFSLAGSPASRLTAPKSVLICCLLLPTLLGAQQEVLDQEPLPDADTGLDEVPVERVPQTHANRPASDELLQEAALHPVNIIGKTLVLNDGESEVRVGPVKDLRKRRQNAELYLVVDASSYFNTTIDYAVALKDVGRMEGNKLVISEAPGMHLRGLEYYADDYTTVTAPATPETGLSDLSE
ncbi:MAG TPA: hypothetical protein GX696_07905 [Pseudomonadaceae bacterium]|nr:hypothetical protein [Pseudomonadaceae bacterium]